MSPGAFAPRSARVFVLALIGCASGITPLADGASPVDGAPTADGGPSSDGGPPSGNGLDFSSERCLAFVPPGRSFPTGSGIACVVRESLAAGSTCAPALGRRAAVDARGSRVTDTRDPSRVMCEVAQIAVLPGTMPDALMRAYFGDGSLATSFGRGFYYDTSPDPGNPSCRQRISFTPNSGPASGVSVFLVCT